MDEERAETVREWDSRSVEAGHAGLRQLAEAEFSGAVEGGRTMALVTNGRIVHVSGGVLDDLADARLTAYEAPDDALPLLFAMQERGGETRGQYYTEDTPLSEVNRTLEDGGFTGYIELSENVLSGDYYVVYHGGRSSSVAFVGNSRRLLTGDEAFRRADDEVGIYRVVDAPVEVIDLPGEGTATDDGADDRGTTPAGPAAAAGSSMADAETGGTAGAKDADPTTADPDPAADAADRGVTADADGGAEADRRATDDTDRSTDHRPFGGDEEIRVGAGLGTPNTDDDPGGDRASTDPVGPPSDEEVDDSPVDEDGDDGPEVDDPAVDGTAEPGNAAEAAETGDAAAARAESPDKVPASDEATTPQAPDGEGTGREVREGTDSTPADDGPTAAAGASADRVADLEATRDRLEAELAEAREELDRVRDERDEYRADAERLRERVATLEARIEDLEVGEAETTPSGPSLSPEEALAGTNLFVRYRSKGDPTLEAASRGEADREAVNDNLRIEHHTTFETEGATVGDRPFEAFLADTLPYRFVRWVVRDLLYELQATGNRRDMGDLYDAIPRIDRIELGGSVRIDGGGGSDDEAAETREFDVVFRDRMSAPLAVANLHESRSPASGELVERLIEDASTVTGDAGTIGTAFAVTTSYYEPPAHEAADAATGGGFLSRSRQKSYVKLDRNRGFHLCLVEARDGEFNLNVPEL